MNKFNEAKEKNLEKLESYVPVVARIHGGTHPEFHKVHKIYDEINKKIKEAGSTKPELEEELVQLREITNDYKIPDNVCESYEAVYDMLSELDNAYEAE